MTFLAYNSLWAIDSYWVLLSILGILSSFFAVRVIWYEGLRIRQLALVIAGMILGQWWLIEIIVVRILWTIRGFAP